MVFNNNLLMGGVAASSGGGGGYSVTKSCMFNEVDSCYMHRTPGGDGNRTTWTLSTWYKRGRIETTGDYDFKWFLFADNTGGYGDGLRWRNYQLESSFTPSGSDGSGGRLQTTQTFLDCGAWYHLVQSVDTTQAMSLNRVKVYVNGIQMSNFGTETYPALNYASGVNSTDPQQVGGSPNRPGQYQDGYMAETIMIDGLQLPPSSFGEYTSTGIWRPIDPSGLTFGTNGFYFKYEDSSALGTDSSGNGNTFTTSGLTTANQSIDTPSS